MFPKRNNELNQSGAVVQNVIIVAISNILKLIAGILIGFVIPKIMGDINYGFYKTFTLYCGYIGLLHFGFIDGIYLLVAGTKYDNLDRKTFRTLTRFLMGFQFALTLIFCITSLFFIQNNYGFIFFFLGINVFAINITTYYQYISQITGRFKELSFRNVVQAVLQAISVLVLWLLYHFDVLTVLNFKVYIVIYTTILVLLAAWYIITYRDITFGESKKIKEEKDTILNYFKVGLPLMVANLVSGLIMTVDKQFVNVLAINGAYSIADFGIYSFAYNMLNLITTVISAISIVLYPTIKSYSPERLKSDYNKLISVISILTSFCLLSYQPLCLIVQRWLDQYVGSLPVFRAILPGVILSSCVTMIMFNYYKTIGKHFKFFRICLIILLLSIIADFIAFYTTREMVWISYVSVVVLGVWYLISDYFISRNFTINTFKNIIYVSCMIIGFYAITYFVANPLFSSLGYLALFIILTICFQFDLIKNIKNRNSE